MHPSVHTNLALGVKGTSISMCKKETRASAHAGTIIDDDGQ